VRVFGPCAVIASQCGTEEEARKVCIRSEGK
jgi:hypothetical protein